MSRQPVASDHGAGDGPAGLPEGAVTAADLRTARLHLRRPRPADLPDYVRMHQNTAVMATLGGVRDPDETRAFFAHTLAHWSRHGFGWWTVHDIETGRFAGRGGLRRVQVASRHEVEVGYGFVPEFWGGGLATELAAASVAVAFETLQLQDLVCFTLPSNHASRRVMAKVGFRFEHQGTYAGLPHVFCRLTAAEWRASRPRGERVGRPDP